MTLQGLPDFSAPLASEGYRVYYPYENVGACSLLPDALAVASTEGGDPDFSYQYVRHTDSADPIYAVLRLRAAPQYALDPALALLRQKNAQASLRGLIFSSGFLRLLPIDEKIAMKLPAEALAPLQLAADGLGAGSISLVLPGLDRAGKPSEVPLLVGKLLEEKLLALVAYAELEFVGIAPRLPLTAVFDPKELVTALTKKTGLCVERSALFHSFGGGVEGGLSALPIEINGSRAELDDEPLADALTDWLRVRMGAFVPGPAPAFESMRPGARGMQASTCVQLPDPAGIPSGRTTWDLSLPLAAPRGIALSMDPLQAAYQIMGTAGASAIIKKTTIPQLNTGLLPVSISADVPGGLDAQLSVTLHVPPAPHRPEAIWTDELALPPPSYLAATTLRLSPAETMHGPPTYYVTTSCCLANGDYLEAPAEVPRQGADLVLAASDFPVDLYPVQASARLLSLATLRGKCSWTAGTASCERDFELTAALASCVFAVPKGATVSTLQLQAVALRGQRSLGLELPLGQAAQLDVSSWPAYGPHTVELTRAVAPGARPLFLEVRAEPEDAEPSVLRFTAAEPKQRFYWLAFNPFQPGYVYRVVGETAWSEPQAPFQPPTDQSITEKDS